MHSFKHILVQRFSSHFAIGCLIQCNKPKYCIWYPILNTPSNKILQFNSKYYANEWAEVFNKNVPFPLQAVSN